MHVISLIRLKRNRNRISENAIIFRNENVTMLSTEMKMLSCIVVSQKLKLKLTSAKIFASYDSRNELSITLSTLCRDPQETCYQIWEKSENILSNVSENLRIVALKLLVTSILITKSINSRWFTYICMVLGSLLCWHL